MSDKLTRIETIFLKDRVNHYTRFGRPVMKNSGPSYRGYEYYGPGQLVGYVQWYAGDYGSRLWRFIILMTVFGTQKCVLQAVPGIAPGAVIIMDIEGALKVRVAMKVLDQIEGIGIDPADVSPAYYGHLHQRIMINQSCHRYTMEQHQSFLNEQRLLP